MGGSFLWYGYLEAGDKSSPVVFDRRLDTGNPQTIYLFNLARDTIAPYHRGIVEDKLRELNGDERTLIKRLKSAYTRARRRSGLRFPQPPGRAGRPAGARRQEPQAAEPPPGPEPDLEFDPAWGDEL